MNKKNTYVIFCLLLSLPVLGQGSKLWLSYGQSKFISSPGVEYAHFFKSGWGFELGINSSIEYPNGSYQLSKIEEELSFSLFHNANIGICRHMLSDDAHRLGLTLGLKGYMGSNYEILHYYEDGGYPIYYNSYNTLVHLGVDMGVFYSFKRYSVLFKYDTAFNKLRFGFGYCFGGF